MRHAPKVIKLVFLGIYDLWLINFINELHTNLLGFKLLIFLGLQYSFLPDNTIRNVFIETIVTSKAQT
jgi:hypothetical protein